MTGSGAAIFGFWKSWDDAYAAAQQLRVEGVWARVVRVLEEIPTVEVIDDERSRRWAVAKLVRPRTLDPVSKVRILPAQFRRDS